jgi:hypothetical protein
VHRGEPGQRLLGPLFTLTTARTDVHRFQAAAVHTTASAGFAVARSARKAADRALAERDFRRKGLFVSLGLILVSIADLLLKIRTLPGGR